MKCVSEQLKTSEELQVIQSMARKRIADKEPTISSEGASVAPAKAPTSKAPSEPARAPRSSATSVTHRHKKEANAWDEPAPIPAEQAVSATGLASLATSVSEPVETPTKPSAQPPTREEIAIRAYLIAESRGFQGGSTEEDWLSAERQ